MISVCMASYNGEKYIYKQIISILDQLGADDELIISDDASTDHTVEIIESIDDTRIHLLKGRSFRNLVYNFENALKYASGDYIFLADQDDIWHPKKIDITMTALKYADCVLSDAVVVDAYNHVLFPSFYQLNKKNTATGFLTNLIKNSYIGCCMAFNRKILNIVLPFPSNLMIHDLWIGLITELCGHSIFLKDKLLYYRRHDMNASKTTEKSKNSIFKKFYIRIFFLIMVCIRVLNTFLKNKRKKL